jgi:hypothetical protein
MVSTTSRIVRFLLSSTTTVLRIWAINQLKRDDKNMGFSTKDFRDNALKEIARDIIQPSIRKRGFVKKGPVSNSNSQFNYSKTEKRLDKYTWGPVGGKKGGPSLFFPTATPPYLFGSLFGRDTPLNCCKKRKNMVKICTLFDTRRRV